MPEESTDKSVGYGLSRSRLVRPRCPTGAWFPHAGMSAGRREGAHANPTYSRRFRKRSVLIARIATPRAKSASISGDRTAGPLPLRKIPRMITKK